MAETEECHTISGLEKDANPEQYGEALFATEAQVCAEAPGSQSYYNLKQDIDDDTLRKVLARPVFLTTGTFGSTPTSPYTLVLNNASAFRTAFTSVQWDRLVGMHGIRFTLVFHCIVSKTAFHQGIVSMAFQYGVDGNNQVRLSGTAFPLSVHLPNVRMNFAEETEMVLRVPFVYAEEYLRVVTTYGSDISPYGVFGLVNLTGCPIVAGQSTPRYNIYVSMEDIEFVGASPFATQNVVLQAGLSNNNAEHKGVSNGRTRVSKGHVTDEAVQAGLLSGSLDAVSGALASLENIPAMGSIMGSADWFMRAASGAAKSFGFSKPIDETLPSRHVRTSYAGEGQTDMPTIAYNLAPFQANKLAIDGTLGCNSEDEMSFDYVLGKYSYIYRGDFTTTQATGDVIYGAPVTPSAFWYRDRGLGTSTPTGNIALKTANTLTENAFMPSILCYVGDNFRYWRGNLRFRVSFAATKLHGGRVSFAYTPYRTSVVANSPVSNTITIPAAGAPGPTLTGYVLIFDLQDASTFEFDVPFVYPAAYCPVLEGTTGSVSMTVINPLTANVSVPSTVNFMVEVCAMPGFEFSCPTSSLMSTVPPTGAYAVTYQSGVPSSLDVMPTASQQTQGETVRSIKSIMMMPDYLTIDIPNNSLPIWTLDPWFKTNAPSLAIPMSTTTASLYFAARSSRMAELYAFARGSTLYSFTKEKTGNITSVFSFVPDSGGVATTTFGSFYDKSLNPLGTVVYPEVLESGRVVIPTYATFPRLSSDSRAFDFGASRSALNAQTWNPDVTLAVPRLTVRNTSGATVRTLLGRAAADDAICSQFIGPPICIVLNTLATTNPYVNSGIGAEF